MSNPLSLELRQIIDRIMSLAHCVKTSHFVTFQNAQLHRRELQILWLIAKSSKSFSSQELAVKLVITPGAVTQLIDQLVLKNLVLRQLSQEDRRKTILRLSDGAKAHLLELKRKHLACLKPMFSGLTEDEIVQLNHLLNKVVLPIKSSCDPVTNNSINKNKEK